MNREEEDYKHYMWIVVITFVILISSWTFLFSYLEWWTYIQWFYFAVTTMTTVGYGDLIPTNDITRLSVSLFILISVTLYISTAAIIWNKYLEHTAKKRENIFGRYGDLLEKYSKRNK